METEENDDDDRDAVTKKYFENFHEGSISGFSRTDLQILHIRSHIGSLLCQGKFDAVNSMIRGILYTDRSFCAAMIMWKSKWKQDQGTLLHEMLDQPALDPPVELLQMIIDVAPPVVEVADVAEFLPIDSAVHTFSMSLTSRTPRSLGIIKLLVEADKSPEKRTLRGPHNVVTHAVWRAKDYDPSVDVLNYLLSFDACRDGLVWCPTQCPLYYASRDLLSDSTIPSFLQVLLRATAEKLAPEDVSVASLSACIDICADYLHDVDAIKRLL